MTLIKSPLRYPGGKSRAIKFLSQFFIPAKEFREPFFGGGSVSIAASQLGSYSKFTVSDLNFDLITFWQQLKTNSDDFLEQIFRIKCLETQGKALFNTYVKQQSQDLSEIERAVIFFFINRCSFSGLSSSGGFSQESFEKRFTISSLERLKNVLEILNNFEISHQDYQILLDQPGEDVLIYLDPPYYSATKSKLYGKEGDLHIGFDHYRLAEVLKKCQHKWFMSYDNCDLVRELYKDYSVVEWSLQYGMNNAGRKETAKLGKELLIKNF